MKTYKEFLESEDPAITYRKKIDAKKLAPTRSGSKGDGGDSSDGGGDGSGDGT